jgi:hypothetical protein
VAERTDPDDIQREIERTRNELAETIDAIAEKVSPKRAAARTADRVKAAVRGDTRARASFGVPETGERVTLTSDGRSSYAPSTAADRHESYARAAGLPGGSRTSSLYTVQRRLRVDRVLMAAGAVAVVIAAIVLVRRRRGDE